MSGNVVVLTENLMKLLSILIISGVICMKVSKKIPIPDVVLFILVGVILGPQLLNILDFRQYPVGNQLILSFGAAYILYDGGREVQLHILNKVKVSVLSLATLGVLVSTFLTAFFTFKILKINFIYALLLGSVLASTDPSVLVPLFKNINISSKLKQTIISESAFNDASGAIITFSVLAVIRGGNFNLPTSLLDLLKVASGGILVGFLVGYLAITLNSEKRFNFLKGYPGEISIAAVLGAYIIAQHFNFSGFMATFIVGMISGNKLVFNLPIHEMYLNIHLNFKDTLISILRIMIFTILGTQMNFGILMQYWKQALFIILLLVFVVRPASVLISVIFDRKAEWKLKEVLYLMWTRETGVIPAALAGMILNMKVANAPIISAVTFMAIIITLTFQASTAKYVANLLKLEV